MGACSQKESIRKELKRELNQIGKKIDKLTKLIDTFIQSKKFSDAQQSDRKRDLLLNEQKQIAQQINILEGMTVQLSASKRHNLVYNEIVEQQKQILKEQVVVIKLSKETVINNQIITIKQQVKDQILEGIFQSNETCRTDQSVSNRISKPKN